VSGVAIAILVGLAVSIGSLIVIEINDRINRRKSRPKTVADLLAYRKEQERKR
jgi:hypothetical protein